MKLNRIALVRDASSSMGHLTNVINENFASLLDSIKRESRDSGQRTEVCVIDFADQARVVSPLQWVENVVNPVYRAYGNTALYDAVGLAADTLDRAYTRPTVRDVSYLVVTLTDGEENRSYKHSRYSIQQRLRELQDTDRWTFTFQVPRGARENVARQFGVPLGNVREWEATERGYEVATSAVNSGTQSYFAARSAGKTSVPDFYVTSQLTVDPKTVRSTLDDISHRMKVYAVPKEESIKEAVESRTQRPYVIGQGYYLLMKTEKVQKSKAICVMEKGKRAIWGGKEARDLLGLPHDKDAKVTPGNHSNYDVFVQSTSVNRKLPRGTKLLIDMQQSVNLQPTWDHEGVYTNAVAGR